MGILKEVKSEEILKIIIAKSIFALCRISYSHQNQLTAFTFDWAQVQCSSHIYVTTSSRPSQSVRVWDQSGSSQLTAGPAGPTPTLWRHSVTASVTHLLLLSFFCHMLLEASCSRASLASFCVFWVRRRNKKKGPQPMIPICDVTRRDRGCLSWGGQQASASSLTWDLAQINNCFKWRGNGRQCPKYLFKDYPVEIGGSIAKIVD